MSTQVVVVGAGYAGAGAVKRLESELDAGVDLTWVSENDYHLVLHEAHRCIRDPSVESKISIPVDDIKSESTEFVSGRVSDVDVDERVVELRDGDEIDYDYLLLGIGSSTAFFGIEGLEDHAHELKGLDDVRAIHADVEAAAEAASREDPAHVVVGGAGLSGIQTAGEVAEYRDEHRAPIEITLVEGLDEIFPGNDTELQGALRKRLEERDVEIITGEFISEADEEAVYLGGEDDPGEALGYDVLIWTGGITGQDEASGIEVEQDDRSHRISAEADFQTSDERVFALGDAALVEQGEDATAPPTAQAAWQAAEVAGENVARAVEGRPLKTWRHDDKGTVVSVGDDAVAHGVKFPGIGELPVSVFGGPAARTLKKAIAARWIADVSSPRAALDAWGSM